MTGERIDQHLALALPLAQSQLDQEVPRERDPLRCEADLLRELDVEHRERDRYAAPRAQHLVQVAVARVVVVVDVAGEAQLVEEEPVQHAQALQRHRIGGKPALEPGRRARRSRPARPARRAADARPARCWPPPRRATGWRRPPPARRSSRAHSALRSGAFRTWRQCRTRRRGRPGPPETSARRLGPVHTLKGPSPTNELPQRQPEQRQRAEVQQRRAAQRKGQPADPQRRLAAERNPVDCLRGPGQARTQQCGGRHRRAA